MKLSVSSLLRGGIFTLAAVFAFAFTQPTTQMGYAPIFDDEDPSRVVGWIDASTLQIGVDYVCNPETIPCLYEEEDLNSDAVSFGEFELL
ncbi:hypothetical protein MM213_17440 [Belliella sp. R4-6]|uniref:Uncharacterized protein n=1 Tax=Belliella alkalica TaxID=1730871 RepID=A0ABS9VFU4_9BACT|nr:hypothetical protein [Belliella alkalica]MCH7415288.1 hypothetical protein [Belliella alkalica]